MENKTPRYLNMALGAWLFISTFLWPHSPSQYTNSWVIGLAAIAVAVVSLFVPVARYVNTVLGAWLFVSVWALPTMSATTTWNHILVGLAMIVVSLIPSRSETVAVRRVRRPVAVNP